ncbi:MAG: response regulator transcription factor [Roseivirga sp.]|nr:response regulator transcription factor [Roseivirga sp.]
MKQINCIVVDDEPIAREIIETHLNRLDYVSVDGSYEDAISALNRIEQGGIDLVFLDINMPDISGLSLTSMLGDKVKVIFTTAHREYALEGFDLNAVDYLLKPVTLERLIKAVAKFQELQDDPRHEISHLFVRADRKMVRVDFADILYLESYSDYVKIHLSEGVLVTRESISKLSAQLPKAAFLRIHRSYVVAMDKVTAFTNESVEVSKKVLVLSRSYKEEVLERLGGN